MPYPTESLEDSMNKMKDFALVPVLVIAGIVSIHLMFAVAVIAPAFPVA